MTADEDVYFDTPETVPVIARQHRPVDVTKIRESREYKRLKAKFRDAGSRHRNPDGTTGAPCHLCGGDIRYSLKWPHPQSHSVDHAKTVKEAPELIADVNNWRHAHLDCNLRRGTDEAPLNIGEPSEDW